jgi:hypothetical protein
VTDVLARRYLKLMRLYPSAYRAERGDEIVATLLERAGDRRRPPPREVLGLLRGALQAHLPPGGPARHAWTGGLRAAVLVLLAVAFARYLLRLLDAAPIGRIGLAHLACGLVALHAVRRDRRIVALVAALAWQAVFVRSGTWSPPVAIASLLLLVLLVVGRRKQLPALHPGWWVVAPAVALLLGGPQLAVKEPVYVYSYQWVVTAAAVVLLAALAWADARATFVAAGLLVWQGVVEMVHVSWVGDNPTGRIAAHVSGTWWGYVAVGAAAVLLVAGHLLARRRATLV